MRRLAFAVTFALAPLAFAPAPFAQDAQGAPARDDAGGGYTREQQLLFATPHLDNIRARSALYYDFRQYGSAAEAIEDREILLKITGVSADGAKNLETAFLDDAGKRTYAVENFRGNPILMFFLEWDVNKMGDDGAVSSHHFRRLLRNGFRDAESEEVTFAYGGRDVDGHKVSFVPLASKKGDPRYKNYPAKRYEFILADDIPGGVYSIATRIPAATAKGGAPEHAEMKFNRVEPASAYSRRGAPRAR